MSVVVDADPAPPEPPPFPIARFTVDQYHRMIEAGGFSADDRLELLSGWVVRKMSKGPDHEYVLEQIAEMLRALLPAGWFVRTQAPITFSDSEPEPDLSVVRGPRTEYRRRHPRPDEVALIIEVADSTLSVDRRKARIYAGGGVPQYWIVNLRERNVEVRTGPDADTGTYGRIESRSSGDEVAIFVESEAVGSVTAASCFG